MSDFKYPEGWVIPTKPRIHRTYTDERGWFWRVVTPPKPPAVHAAHYRDTYEDALKVVRDYYANQEVAA